MGTLAGRRFELAQNVFLTIAFQSGKRPFNVTDGRRTWAVSETTFEPLGQLGTKPVELGPVLRRTADHERNAFLLYESILHGSSEDNQRWKTP